jgi:hypothetical protein
MAIPLKNQLTVLHWQLWTYLNLQSGTNWHAVLTEFKFNLNVCARAGVSFKIFLMEQNFYRHG